MKLKLRYLLILTSTLTAIARDAYTTPQTVAQSVGDRVVVTKENARFLLYLGSNARWLVDRRHGVVSAWALEEERPLWSSSGVVFRLNPASNRDIQNAANLKFSTPRPTTEIFGRVYLFLDDITGLSDNETPPSLRKNLLIALDPRAQGRLVWRRRAEDFALFFAPQERNVLRFRNEVVPLPNDELLVRIQGESEAKRFALDAATGAFRLLDD